MKTVEIIIAVIGLTVGVLFSKLITNIFDLNVKSVALELRLQAVENRVGIESPNAP